MPKPKVEALDHIVLEVDDLERSLTFYREVLGLQVVESTWQEYKAGERSFVSIRVNEGTLIDLVPTPPSSEGRVGRGLRHFCLALSGISMEELLRLLDERGVKREEPKERFGARGKGPSVYIKDPDGYTLELKLY